MEGARYDYRVVPLRPGDRIELSKDLVVEAFRSTRVERDRLLVVMVLMFFSMLFWAFFEQAGSSINNFTDRNVDRVSESAMVTAADVGTQMTLPMGTGLGLALCAYLILGILSGA